ncbi:hypothetical protein DB31_8428 [Hyalangium minutum]|uniref:Uncharacterized protein n=1 Tax=Hyalangium minutum TaxID=394096 RepID=A0A085WHB2_9BACT|nr:hypothetical protein DB31_8428 [Hyalangium minutum]
MSMAFQLPSQSPRFQGQVVAVRGTVVDVRFQNQVPPLASALHCQLDGAHSIRLEDCAGVIRWSAKARH